MIAEAIRQARIMHRKAIEETYDGVCAIYERRPFEDPETLDTVLREVQVVRDIPCHLSYSSAPAATETGTGAALTQTIKLFMAPETEVLPGSRIEVTQQGVTENYSRSGQPAVYFSHQEIELTLWKEYA